MVSTIIIAAIGVGTSFLIAFLLEKFGNRKRIKEIQNEINKVNKDMMEAAKKNDQKRQAELEKEADKLPGLMKESMILNLKGMVIALPVIYVVPWLIRYFFVGFEIVLPFGIPFFHQNNTFGPYGWFWVTFVIIGGISQLIYSGIKNLKEKSKNQQAQKSNQVN